MGLVDQQQLENEFVIHTYGRKSVQFVRGEGIHLYNAEGKRYLDFLSGVGSVSVGHSNPAVTAALVQQSGRLLHVGNYFYIEGRGELAAKLSGLLSASDITDGKKEGRWKTFFANSGAEANEGAIKLARKYGNEKLNGATTIVTARKSFHGRTLAALAATGQEGKQAVFAPMPAGFIHVPLNDLEALQDALQENTEAAVCAVMLECIQGEAGIWPCDRDYLIAVRELTAKHGILLIIDEIQTGFFRTGTYPFAFQHYGIIPDAVTMAKGIANGVPMGAFAACGELGDLLQPGEHGSTFGGSPLAIAAANATIDELLSTDTATRVAMAGEYLADGLARLPKVCEVRGRGLMRGITLSEPIAVAVLDAALEEGLVINAVGDSILRFLPPLIVSEEHINEALGILDALLMKEAV